MKNPIIAFLLSFFPGLGLIYIGKKSRGFMYFFGEMACIIFTIIFMNSYYYDRFWTITFLLGIGLYIVSIIDTAITASRDLFKQDKQLLVTEDGKIADAGEHRRFKTIILSFIPGVGHFYLGLNQRGVTILASFISLGAMIFFIALFVGAEFLLFWFVLIVIWIYSFFDTMQQLKKLDNGEPLNDQSIFDDFNKIQEDVQKNKLLATILALFPGAAHLYLGLQKRGIQLMIAFVLSIYIMDVLRLGIFLFAIPVIWFYSFFDGLQKGTKIASGQKVEDEPILMQMTNYQKWIGIGLIVIGFYYLIMDIIMPIVKPILWSYYQFEIPYYMANYIQTIALCLVFIVGGFKLILGKKVEKKELVMTEEPKE